MKLYIPVWVRKFVKNCHIKFDMKLIDGISKAWPTKLVKQQGSPFEIPDCSRDDLPDFFVEMGYKIGAEIGVDRGEFSEKFAKSGLTIYCIDPWKMYEDYTDSRGQKKLDKIYEQTKHRLSLYPNAKIIRKTSVEALSDIPDDSLDFVYIDGNHQLKFVIEDLFEWSKKVKVGGIISGHDYIYTNPRTQAGICHVIYALDAYTRAYKINDWYLLGTKHAKVNEARDKFRSFMFFNKRQEYRK